ncbi:caspase family protein [Myxococcota bacterium]|nr:caspase family protein [Myxococcota bacterium]
MNVRFFLLFSLLFLLTHSPNPAKAAGYAVLVGVGDYKMEDIRDLPSPPSDVEKIKKMLINVYKFPEANIRALVDRDATKANIARALRWLAQASKEGDSSVFYFSGHGSRVKDLNGDEEDGFDETIVPYDATFAPQSHVIDDEIQAWLYTVRSKITIIFDSCHSGTAYKSMRRKVERFSGLKSGEKLSIKYWENRVISSTKRVGRYSDGFRALRVQARPKDIPPDWNRLWGIDPTKDRKQMPEMSFLAAALPEQYAIDAGGSIGSVFTHFLTRFAAKNPAANPEQLIQSINSAMPERFAKMMKPNTEGQTKVPFLFQSSNNIEQHNLLAEQRVCEGTFCVVAQIQDKNGQVRNHFAKDSEIRIVFKLSQPGYLVVLNRDAKKQMTLLYPDTYYDTLSKQKPNDVYFYEAQKDHLLPPGGDQSDGFIKVSGEPGDIETVEILAAPQQKSLQKLIQMKSMNSDGRKSITQQLVSQHLQKLMVQKRNNGVYIRLAFKTTAP